MALTRMKDFIGKTFKDSSGTLKQGHEYRNLTGMYGYDTIGILCRWQDGRLNDDGELPAVEFQDAHIEHFKNGVLHNNNRDEDGQIKPAIIAEYGAQVEYWVNGKQVAKP
jgi:hypothetical protein